MDFLMSLNSYPIQEAAMARLKNRLPELLTRKGWDKKVFIAHCMLAGLGQDTAYRLVRGETNFTTEKLGTIAEVLGVPSIGDIIDIDEEVERA